MKICQNSASEIESGKFMQKSIALNGCLGGADKQCSILKNDNGCTNLIYSISI